MKGTIKRLTSGKYMVEIADSMVALSSVAICNAGHKVYARVFSLGNKCIAYMSAKAVKQLGLRELDTVLLMPNTNNSIQLPVSMLFH